MSAIDTAIRVQSNAATPDAYGAVTHEVNNQPTDLANYNLFSADIALRETSYRSGAFSPFLPCFAAYRI
jgi:putative acyl-CoA dehydrogenase